MEAQREEVADEEDHTDADLEEESLENPEPEEEQDYYYQDSVKVQMIYII